MTKVPYRLAVLNALSSQLEMVNGPDHLGQPFNLSGQVFRGRTEFGEETQLPALSVLESPSPDIGRFAGSGEAFADKWTLLVQGWAKDDKDNPSDPAYYLAAAVLERLGLIIAIKPGNSGRPVDPQAHMLGGLITDAEIGAYVVRPVDKQASSRAYFYLPIRLGLARDVAEPYLSA